MTKLLEPAVGAAGRALLGRIRISGNAYPMPRDGSRAASDMIARGYVIRAGETLSLTEKGAAYLDRIMRCE